MSHRRLTPAALFNAALLLPLAVPAQAYTDPGSGLLLWQMLGAAFVGGMFMVRKFIRRIFGRLKRDGQ